MRYTFSASWLPGTRQITAPHTGCRASMFQKQQDSHQRGASLEGPFWPLQRQQGSLGTPAVKASANAPCTQSPRQVLGQGGHHAKLPRLRAPAARGLESGREPHLWVSICCLCSSLETPNGKGWARGAVQWSTCTGPDLGRFLCGQQPLGRQRHPRIGGDPETVSCAPSTSSFQADGSWPVDTEVWRLTMPSAGKGLWLVWLSILPK